MCPRIQRGLDLRPAPSISISKQERGLLLAVGARYLCAAFLVLHRGYSHGADCFGSTHNANEAAQSLADSPGQSTASVCVEPSEDPKAP